MVGIFRTKPPPRDSSDSMPRIAPYAGEIKALPQKLQTVYERRVMENMGKPFRLSPTEADAEARLHIARLQYLERTKRSEREKQIPMFDAQLTRKRVSRL